MTDGEVLRTVVRYIAPGASELLNVFMHEYQGAGDADLDVLSRMEDWFTNDWGADWADMASDDLQLSEIECDVIKLDGTVKRNIGSATIALDGLDANDMVPPGVASLMTANTVQPKQRGRKYVPGASELVCVDGLWNANQIAHMVLLLIEYIETITGTISGDLVPGVLSTTLGSFQEFATSAAITDVPAYQRRRKPNVGS